MGAYGTSQGGGAWGGGLGGTPQLGNLPLRALVCDGAITGWLGYGYLRMRDYGSSLYMPSATIYSARASHAAHARASCFSGLGGVY